MRGWCVDRGSRGSCQAHIFRHGLHRAPLLPGGMKHSLRYPCHDLLWYLQIEARPFNCPRAPDFSSRGIRPAIARASLAYLALVLSLSENRSLHTYCCAVTCFMPSKRLGVTFKFMKTLAGLPFGWASGMIALGGSAPGMAGVDPRVEPTGVPVRGAICASVCAASEAEGCGCAREAGAGCGAEGSMFPCEDACEQGRVKDRRVKDEGLTSTFTSAVCRAPSAISISCWAE